MNSKEQAHDNGACGCGLSQRVGLVAGSPELDYPSHSTRREGEGHCPWCPDERLPQRSSWLDRDVLSLAVGTSGRTENYFSTSYIEK